MLYRSNFFNPLQITFLTTNTCTAACGHCSVYSSPDRRGSLHSSQMINTIDEFSALSSLKLVIFAGGEPTLLGKQLLDTIAYADSLGLMTRMVTNAHWATSISTARKKMIEFREAGLRELNISCDDYHVPYIPLDRVKFAWHASRDLGFDAVVIASASGPGSVLVPDKIREVLGDDVPDFFDDDGSSSDALPVSNGSVRMISNSHVSRMGRGESIPLKFMRFPTSQTELDMGCPWIDKSPAISPENHLLACCGMEAMGKLHLDYGSLAEHSVRHLLEEAQKDVVVAAIKFLGPYKLMKFLQEAERDANFLDRYTGVCETCAHIFSRPSVVKLLEKHLGALQILVTEAQRRAYEVMRKSRMESL